MAFDTALTPSDPQVVRYEVPKGTARVRARLLYRKFTAAYAAFACADLPAGLRARCLDLPIAEIASAEIAAGAPRTDDPATLVDWGIALADATADHAEEGRAPLEAARAKWPTRVEPLIGLARLAYRLGQTDDVVRYAARGAGARRRSPGGARAGGARAAGRLPFRGGAPRRRTAGPAAARRPHRAGLVARARGLTGDAAGRADGGRRAAGDRSRIRGGLLPALARARRAGPARRRRGARRRATSSTASRSRPTWRCATAGGACIPGTPTNPSRATRTG